MPGDSLVEVGGYDGVEGRIELLGEDAERELCEWLAVDRLDPAELERPRPISAEASSTNTARSMGSEVAITY